MSDQYRTKSQSDYIFTLIMNVSQFQKINLHISKINKGLRELWKLSPELLEGIPINSLDHDNLILISRC